MTPRRSSYLVFGAPELQEAEIAEVVDTLRSGWIGTGPKVQRFEQDFARYKGVSDDQAAAVGSCTAALQLAMKAAGIGPGDEVIVPAMTFCATVNAVIHTGATPVLADIDPVTWNVDPDHIAARLTPRTRALIPVHFAGRPCQMRKILALAERHGLMVVEDCAHAIETLDQGRSAGTFGQFGCFSFYATKNITTAEGGMVLCQNAELAAKIRRLALHGLSKDAWRRFSDSGYKHYLVEECGYKCNLTDLQASLGIHQLARIEENWGKRLNIWNVYMRAFASLPLGLPAEFEPGTRHALHLFTVRISKDRCGLDRDTFLTRMHQLKIGCGVHYLSISEHPYYRQTYGWHPEDTPVAFAYGRETVSLPLSPYLTERDVSDVIDAVYQVLGVQSPDEIF